MAATSMRIVVSTIVLVMLAYFVGESAYAGGDAEVPYSVSCSAVQDFPRYYSDVAHRSGSKPYYWELQWREFGEYIGPVWKFDKRSGEVDLVGPPPGYVLEAFGVEFDRPIWTPQAFLRPVRPIVSNPTGMFPSNPKLVAQKIGINANDAGFYLDWNFGPEWHFWSKDYQKPPFKFMVPHGFTLEVNTIRYSEQAKPSGRYGRLRPAGPPCNAP